VALIFDDSTCHMVDWSWYGVEEAIPFHWLRIEGAHHQTLCNIFVPFEVEVL